MLQDKFSHIVLLKPPEKLKFTSPKSGGSKINIPQRNRQQHSEFIKQQLTKAWENAKSDIAISHSDKNGIYLEFMGEPGFDLLTKSLENMRPKEKIRLCNIRTEKSKEESLGDMTYATVFVPNTQKKYFFTKIKKYAEENLGSGEPKNKNLIESISNIRAALLRSFWQDDYSDIPKDINIWCEAWLRYDSETNSKYNEVTERFKKILDDRQITFKNNIIKFPERAVMLIYANGAQLNNLMQLSGDIAEYCKAKEAASFWTNLTPHEQAEWTNDLLNRLRINKDSKISVCILDTGVNNGHPLISPILNDNDCQSVDTKWGTHDHCGHGTLMAGISGYGNLTESLDSSELIYINHILESVKILPSTGRNAPELWGDITSQGISRAEIQAPGRKRISCMAINAKDTCDGGTPTSWSGALDQLAFNAEGEKSYKRMIIVSAGNSDFIYNATGNYPDAQLKNSILDPAQSWNTLTVGGYTNFSIITDPTLNDYTAIAPKGGLSPFTTTSLEWDNKWPIKPDVVMESGNLAKDGTDFKTESAELSILSTHYKPQDRSFEFFNMTSASTAQAARFAAQIQSQYPDYWPETVRALLVHSAEWTKTLKDQFLNHELKTEYGKLLRICGYGVPNLKKALYSASNSLTLISQAYIQPYMKEADSYKTKDMHLYNLPWPKNELIELAKREIDAQMRITLSYFIEPSPCHAGWKDRYRYTSHALRFDIKSPTETKSQFTRRINRAARDEDEDRPRTSSASDHWVLGSQARDKGSIHSDIWKGTAAELSDSNMVAVYPVVGWWKERHYLGKFNEQTRYSLIVSITTAEESIDIYTPVATQVGIRVPIAFK